MKIFLGILGLIICGLYIENSDFVKYELTEGLLRFPFRFVVGTLAGLIALIALAWALTQL